MARNMARVLITRAEPEASATAALVAQMGHDPVTLPLTQTETLSDGLQHVRGLAETDRGLLVATSARAIQVLAEAGLASWAVKYRWAVVGERAASLLRDLGADLIARPTANVSELIDLLSGRDEAMIYLAAADRKPALEDRFPAMQVIAIYRARALGGFDTAAINLLRADPPDHAFVYSARGANLLSEAITTAGLSDDLRGMRWLCLSPDVADHSPETVRGDRMIMVAEKPTQNALLAMLPAPG